MRRWQVLALIAAALVLPSPLLAQDRVQARSMVISQYGVVAAEQPIAARAGTAVLERGGNAIDAAVAANAAMGLVAPMMDGIGGDRGSTHDRTNARPCQGAAQLRIRNDLLGAGPCRPAAALQNRPLASNACVSVVAISAGRTG